MRESSALHIPLVSVKMWFRIIPDFFQKKVKQKSGIMRNDILTETKGGK